MKRTRLRHHKALFPHVRAVQDKFIDIANGDKIVSITYTCRKCGERKSKDFRDKDVWPIGRAHKWFGMELSEHGHREQGVLRLAAAVQ